MAIPTSGPLSLYATIGTELEVSQSNVSLRSMSNTAGFSAPDAMSEFYGYSNSYPVINHWLVVAGGGGGGGRYYAGGGGGGGFRSNYGPNTGGGGSVNAEPDDPFTSGQVYTIVVGAGGNGGTSGNPGSNGGVSSLSGTGISTITSLGGGGGGNSDDGWINGDDGKDGGSGGGTGFNTNIFVPGEGFPGQGRRGGQFPTVDEPGTENYFKAGTGGGGSSQEGYSNNASGSLAGKGGDGQITWINNQTYAGGGAGAMVATNKYNVGQGGAGGGGNAGAEYAGPTVAPQPGQTNTGGGGGASCWSYNPTGGNGGSGIVILRVDTSLYSGIHTGNPTVQTNGSVTLIIYTQSGTYTA